MPPDAVPAKNGGYLIPNRGQGVINAGKPKGRRSLSTIVRDMGERPIDWALMPDTPKTLELKARFRKKSAFEAITVVAADQALKGDNQAREWLRRAGYGDKMDITSNEETINQPVVQVSAEMASDFAEYLLAKTKAPIVIDHQEGEIVDNKEITP